MSDCQFISDDLELARRVFPIFAPYFLHSFFHAVLCSHFAFTVSSSHSGRSPPTSRRALCALAASIRCGDISISDGLNPVMIHPVIANCFFLAIIRSHPTKAQEKTSGSCILSALHKQMRKQCFSPPIIFRIMAVSASNQMTTQNVRGGGTVCIANADLWQSLMGFVSSVEPC